MTEELIGVDEVTNREVKELESTDAVLFIDDTDDSFEDNEITLGDAITSVVTFDV